MTPDAICEKLPLRPTAYTTKGDACRLVEGLAAAIENGFHQLAEDLMRLAALVILGGQCGEGEAVLAAALAIRNAVSADAARQADNTTVFKGVLWSRGQIPMPGGPGHKIAVTGVLLTNYPMLMADEVVLAGSAPDLAVALSRISHGTVPYKIGDANSVLTDADVISTTPPAKFYVGECDGCGAGLYSPTGKVQDGEGLTCGCDGHWMVDTESVEAWHDDACMKCEDESNAA